MNYFYNKLNFCTSYSLMRLILGFPYTYCLGVWYSFIFDSFGASHAVYRNLWYIKFPLWKEICFLGAYLLFLPRYTKINILAAQYQRISNMQGVSLSATFENIVLKIVGQTLTLMCWKEIWWRCTYSLTMRSLSNSKKIHFY